MPLTAESANRIVLRSGKPLKSKVFASFLTRPSLYLFAFLAAAIFSSIAISRGTNISNLVPYSLHDPVQAVFLGVAQARALTFVHALVRARGWRRYTTRKGDMRFGVFYISAAVYDFPLNAAQTIFVAGLPFAAITALLASVAIVFPAGAADICGVFIFAHSLGCIPDLETCAMATRYHRRGFQYVAHADGTVTMSVDAPSNDAVVQGSTG